MSHRRNVKNISQNTDNQQASLQNIRPIEDYNNPPHADTGVAPDLVEYNGGPIPESVRQSYLQQKLPVRKQSLVAYGRTRGSHRQKIPARRVGSSLSHPPDRLIRSLTIGNVSLTPLTTGTPSDNGYKSPTRSATVTLPSSSSIATSSTFGYRPANNSSNSNVYSHALSFIPPQSLGTATSTNDLNISLPTIHSSSMVTAPTCFSEESKMEQSTNDDDDDFDFGDRPPSTIDCTQPNVSTSSVASLPNKQLVITTLGTSSSSGQQNTMYTNDHPPHESSKTYQNDHSSVSSLLEPTITDNTNKSRFGSAQAKVTTCKGPSIFVERSTKNGNDKVVQHPYRQKSSQRSYYTPALSSSLSTKSSLPSSSHFYPALLSHMAQELYRRLPVRTLIKDDIEYHLAFNGKEAVDCLLKILCVNDRNLGLLVGRALDHQHFIHDVTYEHRLRDSQDKIYQFKDQTVREPTRLPGTIKDLDEKDTPNGIFALLTTCYSPTCAQGQGCYSAYCPRKGKSIKRTLLEKVQERKLWIDLVPKAIVDATPREEIKRQECIYELIYTEEDFVKDLHYIHKYWVKPLITLDIIPDERREHFVQELFWNLADIEKANIALSQALATRQKQHYAVKSIGDILINHVFDSFVSYGAHQVISKFKLEQEKKRNPVFARFVQTTERRPESRRLELYSFLTKPLSRLGKYNLLLREILRRTPKDNSDYETIPKVMNMITGYLMQVNAETGKCENIFNLQQIEERLSFKSTLDYVDLALRDPQRELILQGRMKRKGNSSPETSDLHVFLFDHYLVFAKIKYFDHLEYYKVYKKPIPLELLTVSTLASNIKVKRASTLLTYSIGNAYRASDNLSSKSTGITFYHHGRKGFPPMTLHAPTAVSQKTWIDQISRQQNILMTRAVFTPRPLVRHHFMASSRIHDSLVTTLDSKNTEHVLIGTDTGVYHMHEKDDEPVIKQVLTLDRVTQMELMDGQLLVLADKTVWTFGLDDILDSIKPVSIKKGRIISTHTGFFHLGECMNKTMICIVKPNHLATTIRVLEPISSANKTKSSSKRRLPKPYKDLYLPCEASALRLLKSKMCITCPREIGVVDMKTFGVQTLLDPADEALAFVFKRQDIRPITIYRLQMCEYLVCYNEFGFFVDQRGRWIRSSQIMEWHGQPDTFALSYPYLLSFEPDFIEIRHIVSGKVEQLIRGKNIKCINSRKGTVQGSMNEPDDDTRQMIFQLDRIAL